MAPAQVAPAQVPPVQRKLDTAQLITAMLKSHGHVSDLIFSPGRAPQIEVSGQLVELKFKGLERLTPQATRMRVVANEGALFFKDSSTATEIILQTAQTLENNPTGARRHRRTAS